MAQIEEQQKAIFNLKANLMDDLNEKGVLSDPECQRVIKIHQEVGLTKETVLPVTLIQPVLKKF